MKLSTARTAALLALLLVGFALGIAPGAASLADPEAAGVPAEARRRDLLRARSMPTPSGPGRPSAEALRPAAGAVVSRDRFGFVVSDVWTGDGSASDNTTLKRAKDAGATWMLGMVSWSIVEPSEGQFAWPGPNDLDNVANGGAAYGLKVLVRLQKVPAWATYDGSGRLSQVKPEVLRRSLQTIAAHGRGRVAAYQIFNEPNLDYEWGEELNSASPGRYAALLRAAYLGLKAGDPEATVVSAGLAVGAYSPSMDDLTYLRGLYAAGARGGTHFDAVGSHPYGGNTAPESTNCGPTCFRRAEAQHQILLDHGDSVPMWATEVGWLHDTPEDLGIYFNWMKVSPALQADYLVRAFQYAEANWPWMPHLFVFGLDFSTAMWCGSADTGGIGPCYPPNTSLHWFSVLNPDRSPRPAYTALQAMPKTGGPVPSPTPTTTPVPTATATPTSTRTAIPTATPTRTSTPTAAGTATTTPAPAGSPTPGTAQQRIPLHAGWNWFSPAVTPTDPRVPGALASLGGRYDLLLGEKGSYQRVPPYPEANTLDTLEVGRGYFLRMNGPGELVITGSRLPAGFPLVLAAGWNWIGYLPGMPLDLPAALASLGDSYDLLLGEAGVYSPPPALPLLNNLSRMEPGRGYLIRLKRPAALTYPSP